MPEFGTIILKHVPAKMKPTALQSEDFIRIARTTIGKGDCASCGSPIAPTVMSLVDPLPAGLRWRPQDSGWACHFCGWWIYIGSPMP